MFDERAFIARVEAAGPDELAQLLIRPSGEEETALRAHLGDERYQRMHGMALRRSASRGLRAGAAGGDDAGGRDRANIVVIHGIMGGELTVFDRKGGADQIWVKVLRLIGGRIGSLRLAEDGRTDADPHVDVRATGIMKRFYGELLLSLSLHANVRAFWFDWRKDLDIAADALAAQITGWFGTEAPVHLVAHSMGGLVARTFIKNHPERWERMGDPRANHRRGGRLVMLGTPNHGSFAIPQVIVGLEDTVKKLALLDLRNNTRDLLRVFNTFVGSYQMLPSPLVMPEVEPLYRAETYGDLNVSQRHLDNARAHHEQLAGVADGERMVYVAGCHQPTLSGVRGLDAGGAAAAAGRGEPWKVLLDPRAYAITLDGDNRVPHRLGFLKGVPNFFIEESHGALPANPKVLNALEEILATGGTSALPRAVPPRSSRRGALDAAAETTEEAALRRLEAQGARDREQIQAFVRRAETARGGGAAGAADTDEAAAPPLPPQVRTSERVLEEIVVRGFLGDAVAGDDGGGFGAGGTFGGGGAARDAFFEPARIEIGLVHGRIDEIGVPPGDPEAVASGEAPAPAETDTAPLPVDLPVDALSVGHYLGVRPQFAELALDVAISRALYPERFREVADPREVSPAYLLLTQYSERGTIRGELGQPFFLNDPRPGDPPRVIAIAGMGVPGRFGVPELTVLARELCWAVGRMGKQHLATVLIGAGVGNLPVAEAISAWIRGIKHAVSGTSAQDQGMQLRRVTFVEMNPGRIREMEQAILAEQRRLGADNRMRIHYEPLTPEQGEALDAAIEQRDRDALEREVERRRRAREQRQTGDEATPRKPPAPTRMTLGLERDIYRYGAITETASVPEREVPLDPSLVMTANDELAAQWDLARQHERGRFLERLLLPDDLRGALSGDAPLVLMLDAATARIHWEMVAQPRLAGGASDEADGVPSRTPHEDLVELFLGTSRGFTRQLRTTFAPPPEPPPPPRRILRVLVVADPAEDMPLPGAEEEGVEVADLFESFNTLYENVSENRVEVVRLFGPREATRTNVLRHLMLRSYDVLHFAGHCVYDPEAPAASGWIFTGGKRLSAREMNRIDRIPKFVFSNACESGITPDRSEQRSAALAPSFAEAFFARGVSNFVCTAWPVDDAAARTFAQTLYGALLGITRDEETGRYVSVLRGDAIPPSSFPSPMHVAMREARLATARTANGLRTWGAYQHYGNPYLQLFDMSGAAVGEGDRMHDAAAAAASKGSPGDGRGARGRRSRATARTDAGEA